jgi:hypothetical protein
MKVGTIERFIGVKMFSRTLGSCRMMNVATRMKVRFQKININNNVPRH